MEEIKNWIRPIICGLAIAFMVWPSKYLWESGKMKTYIVDFITTFSPIIIGLLAFFIYWIVRDYKKRRQFNRDIEKWIGYFSFKDDKGSYSDLKGKIKRYIQEELEIESARRVEADRANGEKINKLVYCLSNN